MPKEVRNCFFIAILLLFVLSIGVYFFGVFHTILLLSVIIVFILIKDNSDFTKQINDRLFTDFYSNTPNEFSISLVEELGNTNAILSLLGFNYESTEQMADSDFKRYKIKYKELIGKFTDVSMFYVKASNLWIVRFEDQQGEFVHYPVGNEGKLVWTELKTKVGNENMRVELCIHSRNICIDKENYSVLTGYLEIREDAIFSKQSSVYVHLFDFPYKNTNDEPLLTKLGYSIEYAQGMSAGGPEYTESWIPGRIYYNLRKIIISEKLSI